MLTVPKSEAQIYKLWKQPWDSQSNGRFFADSQGGTRMSDGEPRTRMFRQMWVTVGDTACNVNGVQMA